MQGTQNPKKTILQVIDNQHILIVPQAITAVSCKYHLGLFWSILDEIQTEIGHKAAMTILGYATPHVCSGCLHSLAFYQTSLSPAYGRK